MNQSMMLLKDKLAGKYEGNETRKIFTEDDLWQHSYDVLQEYPVILSTTFSSRNSLKEDVVCHFPMNMLIKNPELLNERECRYAMNPATHIDFLLYNRISKKPMLAVEVDGYEFHKADTEQASRDLLKNHILDLYEIPWLRLKTNGSREKEQIVEKLDEILT